MKAKTDGRSVLVYGLWFAWLMRMHWDSRVLNFTIVWCCCSSVTDPMDLSMPYFLVLHSLPELLKLMSIELVMPSNHLILCHPRFILPSIFSSIKIFSNESALRIKGPKYWSFSFSISPSSEYSGFISFRMTGLISLLSKGLSRVFSNTMVQKHQFFGAELSLWSNSHIHKWLLEKS